MAITIKEVSTSHELKKFIRFNYELYRKNPYSVPDLYDDMLKTFDPKKNAAFEFCEAKYFLAYDENEKIVGRTAGIINHRANETWNKKEVRFGWIDFIDDIEVSKALIHTVEDYGHSKGMDTIVGPLGFTDMDAEGMLVDGFDKLSTMATIYNYPYYPKHIEQLGFEKDADWVEFKINIPDGVPVRMQRIADIVKEKYGLKIVKCTSSKKISKDYGESVFKLVNEAYAKLYGFSALSEGQIRQYVKEYLPILDLKMVTLITNKSDELVGFGITMPSLSIALQKAKGKLLPLGWWHLMKALWFKTPPCLDLLLIAVKPEFQNKGVNALLFTDLIPVYISKGYKYAESNPELEINSAVQKQWEYFDTTLHKRRRAYRKPIESPNNFK